MFVDIDITVLQDPFTKKGEENFCDLRFFTRKFESDKFYEGFLITSCWIKLDWLKPLLIAIANSDYLTFIPFYYVCGMHGLTVKDEGLFKKKEGIGYYKQTTYTRHKMSKSK